VIAEAIKYGRRPRFVSGLVRPRSKRDAAMHDLVQLAGTLAASIFFGKQSLLLNGIICFRLPIRKSLQSIYNLIGGSA
jgi:hypothetical protein